ncbi:MAG: DUF1569 domain-containing protein [Pirellulaceae bacterium]|nr:DUF1569 domain-containing protein [Pirellulaceae bacterium]
MPSVVRRNLEFHSLDDAVADSCRLLAEGYSQAGNWNLSQVLGHCSDWLRFSMDGYPPTPLPLRPLVWLMRVTIGKPILAKTLKSRTMKSGGPTMRATVKGVNESDDAAAVDSFGRLVERFKRFDGPYHTSPLFGSLSRDEMRELQIIHLQHHLSFLVPNARE